MPAPLTGLLGTRYPIVSAPMGAVAGGRQALSDAVDAEQPRSAAAVERADLDTAAVRAGEGIDLIHAAAPAAEIVRRLVAETDAALARAPPP